jgi:hypothetical protein
MNNLYNQISNKYNYKTINHIINNIDSSYKNKHISKDEYIFLKNQLKIYPVNYINSIFKILILNSKQKNKKILVSTILPLKQINNDFNLNEMIGGNIIPQTPPLLTQAEINQAYFNKLNSSYNTPLTPYQQPSFPYQPQVYQPTQPYYGYSSMQPHGYMQMQAPKYMPTQPPGYMPTQPPGYMPMQAPGYPPMQAPGYMPIKAPGFQPPYASSLFMPPLNAAKTLQTLDNLTKKNQADMMNIKKELEDYKKKMKNNDTLIKEKLFNDKKQLSLEIMEKREK